MLGIPKAVAWLPVLIPLSKVQNMGEIPGPSGLPDWTQRLMVTRTASMGTPHPGRRAAVWEPAGSFDAGWKRFG